MKKLKKIMRRLTAFLLTVSMVMLSAAVPAEAAAMQNTAAFTASGTSSYRSVNLLSGTESFDAEKVYEGTYCRIYEEMQESAATVSNATEDDAVLPDGLVVSSVDVKALGTYIDSLPELTDHAFDYDGNGKLEVVITGDTVSGCFADFDILSLEEGGDGNEADMIRIPLSSTTETAEISARNGVVNLVSYLTGLTGVSVNNGGIYRDAPFVTCPNRSASVYYLLGDYGSEYSREYILSHGTLCASGESIDIGVYAGKPYALYAWSVTSSGTAGAISLASGEVSLGYVKASPEAGVISGGSAVTLSAAAAVSGISEYIMYTTDGTIPTGTNGTQYTSPVVISSETVLMARLMTGASGYTDDIVSAFHYYTAGAADRYEPNDTVGTAAGVSFPGRYEAYISTAGDVDCYRFTLDETTVLDAVLQFPSGTQYGMELLDGTGAVISSCRLSDFSSIRKQSAGAGTYYVKVYPVSGYSATESYTLRILKGTVYSAGTDLPNFSELNMATAWSGKQDGNKTVYTGTAGNSLNVGGNFVMVTQYLSLWDGPVNETDDPYTPSGSLNQPHKKLTPSDYHLQAAVYAPTEAECSSRAEYIERIKALVYAYGSVQIGMPYYSAFLDSTDKYLYSYTNSSYYVPNHGVSVIGWDDSCARTNFRTGHQPASDGAFLIKNSWGTGENDGGYFYLSYDSLNIGTVNPAALIMEEGTGNYNREYVNDASGAFEEIDLDGAASVYNRFSSGSTEEKLTAVSHTVYGENVDYEIYVTVNGTKTKILSGSEKNAGYYTHRLESPVIIPANTDFILTELLHKEDGGISIAYGYADAAAGYAGYQKSDAMTDLSSQGKYPSLRAFTTNGSGSAEIV